MQCNFSYAWVTLSNFQKAEMMPVLKHFEHFNLN